MYEIEIHYRKQELDRWQQTFIELQTVLAEERGDLKAVEALIAGQASFLASEVAPEVTGHLKRAIVFEQDDEMSTVYISPDVMNPFSPEDPHEYGPEVHAMGGVSKSGGQRAFFSYVIEEHGDDLLDLAEDETFALMELILV